MLALTMCLHICSGVQSSNRVDPWEKVNLSALCLWTINMEGKCHEIIIGPETMLSFVICQLGTARCVEFAAWRLLEGKGPLWPVNGGMRRQSQLLGLTF